MRTRPASCGVRRENSPIVELGGKAGYSNPCSSVPAGTPTRQGLQSGRGLPSSTFRRLPLAGLGQNATAAGPTKRRVGSWPAICSRSLIVNGRRLSLKSKPIRTTPQPSHSRILRGHRVGRVTFHFRRDRRSRGRPHNNQAAQRMVGLVAFGALAAFGLAVAHSCASLRQPAKTLMQPASAYTNPEDALAAAFQLDMHGEWDAANALYGEVARRWPEHEQYAQGRVTEIEEKQSRANQP